MPKDIERRRVAGGEEADQSCAFIALDAFQAVSVNWPDQLIPTSSLDAISARTRWCLCAVYTRVLPVPRAHTCVYTHTHTHVVFVPSFLSFPLNSSFFSILLLSVQRGNKRTPICPRKTKNLFHARRRFLAFSAAPRHQIPSLFSPCLWDRTQ